MQKEFSAVWGTGAARESREVTGEHLKTFQALLEHWKDCGTFGRGGMEWGTILFSTEPPKINESLQERGVLNTHNFVSINPWY
jgi:hypothetical protein